jgi:hypothetical protein
MPGPENTLYESYIKVAQPELFFRCNIKENEIIDASAYFGPGGGSQFEGYPFPFCRLGSSWLSVSIFLGYLVEWGVTYILLSGGR